mgnify:CR=1 FL=1
MVLLEPLGKGAAVFAAEHGGGNEIGDTAVLPSLVGLDTGLGLGEIGSMERV